MTRLALVFARAIAVALASASVAVTVDARTARAVPDAPAPLRIEVLGDSLALGTGANDPANGLAFRIYRTLAADRPGSEVTDRAIGGSRAADVLRLQVNALNPRSTDLVLLIAGGNDVVRRTSQASFARTFAALLGEIHARVPNAIVIVFGVPDVARSPIFADAQAKTEALSAADNAIARNAAAIHHDPFVDLFAFTKRVGASAEFFSSDDFHPSDAGYERLASFAIPIVERAIAR